MRSRLRVVLLAALGASLPMLGNQNSLPIGISWNYSPSLPIGLYWHTRANGAPKVGELVCTAYRAPDWARDRHYVLEGWLLCKRIVGLPGTRIRQVADRLELCDPGGCRDGGQIVQADSRGRSVHAAKLPLIIPPGHLYLGSTCVSVSFDSRYFGLIAVEDLVRTLHPIVIVAAACKG